MKIVDSAALDAGLTATADAIRGKTGSEDAIAWDAEKGFAGAVKGIPEGVSEQDLLNALAATTWPGADIVITGESVGQCAFQYSPILKSVKSETVTSVGTKGFYICQVVESIELPNLRSAGSWAFEQCNKLSELIFPKLETVGAYCMKQCAALKRVDSGFISNIGTACFQNSYVLQHIVLRNNAVCSLQISAAISGTGLAGKNGLVGYCYVPSALISEYQAATNWSTYYEAGTCIFRALEDYTVDGTTTGAMDWAKIEAEEATA